MSENIREKMALIADWLGWQHEDLSYGLRSVEDAVKLFEYWEANDGILPEHCDAESDDDSVDVGAHCIKAIGYDPLEGNR